jgi:gliding motility-associated lipoprotein GldH
MYRFFTALAVSVVIASSGCDKKRLFEGYKDFPDRQWIQSESAEFEFLVENKDIDYNIYYSIRNTNAYPFQNLFLQYYLEDSTGNLLSKDLKNIQLFHPVTGVPVGDGMGDIFVLKKPFLENFKFEESGIYRLRIDHFMRMDTLPEIISVGIRVEESSDEETLAQ